MFGRIARRYDLANRVLSCGIDIYWRIRLVSAVRAIRPGAVLDLATGSGDVAFALAGAMPLGVCILGMDFCEPMLAEAEAKKARRRPPACEGLAYTGARGRVTMRARHLRSDIYLAEAEGLRFRVLAHFPAMES